MERKVVCIILAILLFLVVASSFGFAEETREPGEITKIERVHWSGLSVPILWKEWRIFGSWRVLPRGFSLFGSPSSPYFRLNENDGTVFRGLGRESDFSQWLFSTLHSRKKLRDIITVNEKASLSLEKYDAQVSTGEKVHMGGTALVATGNIGIGTSIIMMLAGLSEDTPTGETPTLLKAGYGIFKASLVMLVIGKIGQLAGDIVTDRAFGHLNDAIDHFNAAPTETSLGSSSNFLVIKLKRSY